MFKIFLIIQLVHALLVVQAFPGEEDDPRYLDREVSYPGAHQLASWLTSLLRPPAKGQISPTPNQAPILPYRVAMQGKRNSEVTNAIIGSEEIQKMYRNGRK